ncbi:MAG: family 10 glycosylhydrolase [Armatimonadetes bacterium]|nr:family 10 glycosylhydrolase [Armatimonadota bacterium]
MMRWLAAMATCAMVVGVSAQYRDTRPIRGAWLRPPATLAEFEATAQALSTAGITDLYLETFYHGLSTGKAGVFDARFGFDYLQQAIPLAARYNIRIHAWIEASYWQYGTTGAYNFTGHPEYQVLNIATGTTGGDASGQVFANLCHPDVQAKLRAYTKELAAYPGLWGIQTDYHRMPIDNNTSDSYTAPWSYDTYSQAAFKALYGTTVDINTQADKPGRPYWNQFLTWRRNGISEAANQMHQGILESSSDVVFSGAIFPTAMTSSAQIAKCQNWPAWCSNGYVNQVVPMCYGSTTSSVVADINATLTQAGSVRVVPGLAITSGHPAVADQLSAIKANGQEDFVIFDAGTAIQSANQTAIKNWVTTSTKMRADYTNNGTIDAKDWARFLLVYAGSKITVPNGAARFDLNNDGFLDSTDHSLFRQKLRQYRLGESGHLNNSDRLSFESSYTGAGSGFGTAPFDLYDFDIDGDVDTADREWMERAGSEYGIVFASVTLADSVLGPSQPIDFEYRDTSGLLLYQARMTPDTDGKVLLPMPNVLGAAALSVKPVHYLRQSIPLDVDGNDKVNVLISPINGDIDGDNAITIFDYSSLSDSFDSTLGDSGYTADADLDDDGAVTIFDYVILSQNFDKFGDD